MRKDTKKNRGFKGVWIPREIWLSTKLTLQEKCFLVEIDSLDNEKGCFAGNQHFSDFFGLSTDRCSTIITALKNKGFLEVIIDKSSGKSIRTIRRKGRVGIGEKAEWPFGEKAAPSNTGIINTSSISKNEFLQKDIDRIIEIFKEVTPSLSYGNKTQRKACAEMLDKWPFEKVEAMVRKVISVQGNRYAPRATTPYAMWTKIGDLTAFFKGSNQLINRVAKV